MSTGCVKEVDQVVCVLLVNYIVVLCLRSGDSRGLVCDYNIKKIRDDHTKKEYV